VGLRSAVETARALLRDNGYHCETTAEDFILWFRADTPYDQGDEINHVIVSPLYMAHELVEIENVKAMGLELTKDVIIRNMQKVDDAHLKATRIELQLAVSMRDIRHISERMNHISMWIEDPSVTQENKDLYRELRVKTLEALARLKRKMADE